MTDRRRTACICAFAVVLLSGCAAARGPEGAVFPVTATAHDGGQIIYDGTHYHFRAANGVQMLSMWVPPDADPVRGVFISGNPGGIGGDNRGLTRDAGFQAFAARHDFGLLGLHSFPGRMVHTEGAELILGVMKDFAALGFHPEIANLPFITFGNSNGGITSYAMVCSAPERAICFTSNVGPRYNPPVPSDAALQVPGVLIVGTRDPFFDTGVEDTRELVHAARARGARWAWLAEQDKAHEVGRIFDLNAKFYDYCIGRRLPDLDAPGGSPLDGPVTLRPVPLAEGWLADDTSWESGLTVVAPYAEYAGDRDTASWLPDRDTAFLYRGLATYDNPVAVRVRDLAAVANPNASGVLLKEVGGHVIDPGTKLVVEADPAGMPDWTAIEFYESGELIGTVEGGEGTPSVEVTVQPEPSAYSFTVLARDAAGTVRTATPTHFIVGDPTRPIERPVRDVPVRPGSATRPAYGSSGVGAGSASADPADDVLLAYGLTPEQERGFAPDDGRMSAFWDAIGTAQDRAELTVGATASADTGLAGDEDASLIVKAARSRAGLYLYFEARDDGWVDATPGPAVYTTDCVDVLLDNRSSEAIWSDPVETSFMNGGWSLARTTVQLQVNFGATAPLESVRYNFIDPFEFRYYDFARAQMAAGLGMRFDFETLAPNRKAQEWFIPWRSVGLDGLAAEPPAGARLAIALGYNDQDPGQHEWGASDGLRWPGGRSPWNASYMRGRNEAWGDLQMGPLLRAE